MHTVRFTVEGRHGGQRREPHGRDGRGRRPHIRLRAVHRRPVPCRQDDRPRRAVPRRPHGLRRRGRRSRRAAPPGPVRPVVLPHEAEPHGGRPGLVEPQPPKKEFGVHQFGAPGAVLSDKVAGGHAGRVGLGAILDRHHHGRPRIGAGPVVPGGRGALFDLESQHFVTLEGGAQDNILRDEAGFSWRGIFFSSHFGLLVGRVLPGQIGDPRRRLR
mmetsp:Transcript_22108/g.44326  ORF Transcript_22108/g.44326 Transcript_22108/m.44326 type:complete len:215 (-) Transcript_22108:135-779(-)